MRPTISIIIGGVLVLAGAVGVEAQQARWAAPDDQTAKSLIAMERQWAEESCTHHVVVGTVLADDFEGISPKGVRYTKAQAVKEAQSSTERARECRLNDVAVHFFGDSLAIAYGSESAIEKRPDGTDHKGCLVWTDTWLRRKGTWQIVAAQDMPLDCK